jgi:hypothetical protein
MVLTAAQIMFETIKLEGKWLAALIVGESLEFLCFRTFRMISHDTLFFGE